jgi:protease-4
METNLPPTPPPPPLNSPGTTPPIIVNTPPPPRSSCAGWKIFSVILVVLLLGSLAFNFLGLVGVMFSGLDGATGAQSGKRFHEVVVDNPNAKHKIAVLEVKGMISSEPWGRSSKSIADVIDDQLKWAGEDDEVKAVILKVDSPGGEVMASDDIANAIRKFQDKHKKPVVASMGSLAASGGYYISAPCQWIVANDLTITGSIGVILHSINYRGLMDKVGVQPVVFKSGRFKDMLSGSKKPEEQDPAEKEMIQSMIMETYQKFKKVVADGRAAAAAKNKGKGKTLAANWADLADGRVLTGHQALDNGFVDEIGNFETAVETTKRIAGLTGDVRLIRYEEPFDLSNLFSLLGKTDMKKVTIDVGVQAPKLEAGKMYFLYYPQL